MNRWMLRFIWGPIALALVLVSGVTVWAAAPERSAEIAQQGPPATLHSELGVSTRLVSGYGELIVQVQSGSRAEQLGLQAGDVIQAVASRRTTATGILAQALAAPAKNGSLTLKIRAARSGEVTYRTLVVPRPAR